MQGSETGYLEFGGWNAVQEMVFSKLLFFVSSFCFFKIILELELSLAVFLLVVLANLSFSVFKSYSLH